MRRGEVPAPVTDGAAVGHRRGTQLEKRLHGREQLSPVVKVQPCRDHASAAGQQLAHDPDVGQAEHVDLVHPDHLDVLVERLGQVDHLRRRERAARARHHAGVAQVPCRLVHPVGGVGVAQRREQADQLQRLAGLHGPENQRQIHVRPADRTVASGRATVAPAAGRGVDWRGGCDAAPEHHSREVDRVGCLVRTCPGVQDPSRFSTPAQVTAVLASCEVAPESSPGNVTRPAGGEPRRASRPTPERPH